MTRENRPSWPVTTPARSVVTLSEWLYAEAVLAQGASDAARVCREAAVAGFQWPPARKADSEPPYELRRGTGRRGPPELWQRFDQATTRLGTMAAGEDMLEVAGAYEELAAIAGELAEAVAGEDRASSRRSRTRTRRAA